jgi:hypothetical protein
MLSIEHGVLRGNAKSPAALGSLIGLPVLAPRQFSDSDPRVRQVGSLKVPKYSIILLIFLLFFFFFKKSDWANGRTDR